ncbi:E1 DerP2 DerF2 domain containing protein, partial [Asbolus verrucosus]
KDVKKLTNAIYVHFAGVPVAFDENDACDLIYTADGKDKAGCPLKAGQDYIYKNDMNVFDFFPKVKGVVHFAVTGDDGDDVICFEVPAIITN